MMTGKTIVVWFSCGTASAVAAKMALDIYGADNDVRIVNNPVAEEDEDNMRFLRDVERWLGVSIYIQTNPAFPSCSAKDVWAKKSFMSGPLGAPCTVELKKKSRLLYEQRNKVDWHVLGFTRDEKRRSDRFMLTERSNVLPILINWNVTKQDCIAILAKNGIRHPRVYDMGYPNANCIGCVKATSPTYWNLVRKQHPEQFRDRADMSRKLGAKLARYKGRRVFLDELPSDARGTPLNNMRAECGIFCEEK